MDTAEAKTLVKSIRKMDPGIFNIEYSSLRDLVPLASGNFGAVYRGIYKKRQVAVKQLLDVGDEQMHKYLQREIETLRDMAHENIVEFLGVCEHRSGLYIVTEFIHGGDLRKVLKNKTIELTWETRIMFAIHICSAMNFLHTKQIVHRDLKSHNILITEDGIAKICDFGFSRKLPKKRGARHLSLCGTDQWMAPEILMDDPYNEKADIFSFAMVLTELITRTKPTERIAAEMFAFNVDDFRKKCPRDTPRGLVNIIARCAHLTPSKRPPLSEILPKLEALAPKNKTEQIHVNLGSLETTKASAIVAFKNYKAKDNVELSIRKGDTITLIQKDESGWCEGISNNKRGWFPSYVIQEELDSNENSVDNESLTSVEHRTTANKNLLNFLHTRPAPEDLQERNILQSKKEIAVDGLMDKKHKIENISKFLRGRKKLKKKAKEVDESFLDKLIIDIYSTMPVYAHKKKYEAYDKCFYGSSLVEWILDRRHSSETSEARSLGQYLLTRRIIIPLENTALELKDKRLFQLKLHQEPFDIHIVNNIKLWITDARHPTVVIEDLLEKYSAFSLNPTNDTAIEIDIAISELQKVELKHLESDIDVQVFFVNLYNLMTEYLVTRFGEPENEYMEIEIMTKKAFLVGTSLFTLDVIKKSILFLVEPLPSSDPRSSFAVKTDKLAVCLLSNLQTNSAPFQIYKANTFTGCIREVLAAFFLTEFIVSANMVACPISVQYFADLFFKGDIIQSLEPLYPVLPPQVLERITLAKENNENMFNNGTVLYFGDQKETKLENN